MLPYGPAELAASFRTVRKNTILIAEDIPEDKYDFEPAAGVRTLAQMMVHIAVSTRLWQELNDINLKSIESYDFVGAFAANSAEEAKTRSKAEIIALLKSTGEGFATFLEGVSDEFLAEKVDQPGGAGAKTRLESLMGAKEHEMHHRGQLMLAERQIGIVPHLTRIRQERWSQMQAAAKK